jgi:hypothetical protein
MAFSYGEGVIGYFKAESTLGTGVVPVAGDGFRCSDFVITPGQERQNVPETTNTRSLQETVEGRKNPTWSLKALVRPSDTAGTAPDIGLLLTHAFGTETIAASTSVAYTLLKDPSTLFGTLIKHEDTYQQGVVGAYVSAVNISVGGEEFATIELQGGGVDTFQAGTHTANGAGSSATSLIVDDADFYEKYGVIKIGSDDNSGAGNQITAINRSTQTLTVTAASWSDNDTVAPFLPTATLAGTPLSGTVGQVSLDGNTSTVKIIRGQVNYNTGMQSVNNEFGGGSIAADIAPNAQRGVTFSFDMLLRSTEAFRMQEARYKVSQNVIITIGDTAGKRLKINMPTAEILPGAVSGAEGMMNVTIQGTALATSSGEDELDLMFD